MIPVHDLPSAQVSAYGAALRRVRPSAQLDTRIGDLVQRHAGARRAHPTWRIGPALAAGSAAILVAALILWAGGSAQREEPREFAASSPDAAATSTPVPGDAISVHQQQALAGMPAEQYSLWPTDAAVFRVRTRLDALHAVNAALPVGDERQYWIDVRVANDGSMRIVRIVPVDEAH